MPFRAQTLPLVSFGLPAARRTDWPRTTRLLEGAVFYSLLALIPLTAVPYGTVEQWWESSFQCVVFALAALWSIEGLLSGRWFVREHRLLLPLVPLLGFVFWQALPAGSATVGGVKVWLSSSADAYETRLVAFRFLALLLFVAMLLRYTSSGRRVGALVYAVIGVGVLSGVFGLVRQAAHQDGDGFLLAHLQPQLGYGQFINNNHFALLMEMSLGLLLGLLTSRRARRSGLLLLHCAACGVLWPALVLSNSRGGVFSMIGQVVFLALLHGRVLGSRRAPTAGRARGWLPPAVVGPALAVCLLLVVGVGVTWVGGDSLLRRMENLHDEVGVEGGANRVTPRRLEMWRATWRMFEDHPVAGIGFGGYWVAVHRYYDATGAYVPQQAHNDYLELLASGGLVSAALAAWFVCGVIARARKCLRTRAPFPRAACFGALAGLCAVALHSLVDFGLHITANALVCIALVVIATAHVQTRRGSIAGRDRGRHAPDNAPADAPDAGDATRPARLGRALMSAVCLLVSLGAMCATARAGLSRWYSTSPERECLLPLAGRAVRLSPDDPAAHIFRAGLLSAGGEDRPALAELESAVALRPQDYELWTDVGFARERVGDLPGALGAFREAARLAPYYAPPHWQLGTTLLRVGAREEAVAELARASASAPELLPQMIELLWKVFGGDGDAVARALGAQTQASQLAFLRFYMKEGRTTEAIALLRQAGSAADAERRALTAQLIEAKRFTEAHDAWSSAGRGDVAGRGGLAAVNDGSFEADLDPAEPGFGWRVIGDRRRVAVFLDTKEPRAGSRSLRLEFRGSAPVQVPLISQLVLLEANTRYRLGFAARTQELKSTGLPGVELVNADSGQPLTIPMLLSRGDSGWHDYAAEFVTGPATTTVLLTIRRQECPLQPCLIFGRVWLDDFSLRKS